MTAQELNEKSVECYKAGQALLVAAQGGDLKAAIPADKLAEINKHFDEADLWKLQSDVLFRQDKMAKEQADRSKGIRKHPMGESDELAAKIVELKKLGITLPIQGLVYGGGAPATTRLKAEDPRFKSVIQNFGQVKTDEYAAAFESYIRFGKDALADTERKALSTLTDTEGGFVVAEEFRTEVIRKLRNLVWIRDRATVIQTTAGAVAFPTFDPADAQTTPPVTQQNAAISSAALSSLFGKTQFTPHKRAVIIPMPLELLEDAVVAVDSLLTDFFALRFAELNENDFIAGTGVNMPLGLTVAPGLPTLAIAGSTTAMVPEDIVKTVYGMRAVYRRDAAWLMHRLVVQAVRLFRTNIGGAGTGNFMFQPGMQAGQPATLFGYDLLESEFMPNPYTGVAGNPMMMFGNLKYYWIVDRIDMMVQRLNELYAANDQVGFRMRQRYDAAPVLAEPFLFLTRN